jgi:regulator of nucleoside diphosphate kinase
LVLAEGQQIEWPQPDGHLMKVKIEKSRVSARKEGDYL